MLQLGFLQAAFQKNRYLNSLDFDRFRSIMDTYVQSQPKVQIGQKILGGMWDGVISIQ